MQNKNKTKENEMKIKLKIVDYHIDKIKLTIMHSK